MRLCKECKHQKIGVSYWDNNIIVCAHPRNTRRPEEITNPVTGYVSVEPESVYINTADDLRYNNDFVQNILKTTCGVKGNWFEPKIEEQ